MRYLTNDNKVFDDLNEAKEHEEEIRKAEALKLKDSEDRKKLEREIDDLYKQYTKLLSDYYDKYHQTPEGSLVNSLLKALF